jgi:hypothetical protein
MGGRPTKSTQTASHGGVYRVETDPQTHQVLSAGGVPFDPAPSPIERSLPDVVHSGLRIDRPYVREGCLRSRTASRRNRGAEGFVPVSWDQAFDLIRDALLEVREEFGNESIYGGSYGWASAGRLHHAQTALTCFLSLFGGYRTLAQWARPPESRPTDSALPRVASVARGHCGRGRTGRSHGKGHDLPAPGCLSGVATGRTITNHCKVAASSKGE